MKSFVVIGLGRFGSAVALELMQARCEVLAIDIEEKPVQSLADLVTNAVVGDARDAAVLKSLGVDNYDGAVVGIGSDVASSILITLTLKELGVKQVVCKAGSDNHKKALEKIGADRVLIPEREIAARLAQRLASPEILDYVELFGDIIIVERKVPPHWAGKMLADLRVRQKHAVTVVGIHRGEDMLMLPQGSDCLRENDLLVIMGHEEDLNIIEKL